MERLLISFSKIIHNSQQYELICGKYKNMSQKAKSKETNRKAESAKENTENKTDIIAEISKFKYEKKPHIKIEFEKDSPTKELHSPVERGLWEPSNWKDFLVNLRIMRENNEAPVDTMGCHMAMDEKAPPEVMRYHSLIALMLSSQTKDQVTFAAMQRLREKGLTVDNVLNMSDEELGKLIYPVGFWKTKVKYIKKTTQTLKDQYNGDIPDSVEKLCKLTGVGPKMAHICMKVAWNKVTGIGVDTHVHRISNRIGWVRNATSTPEDTRKALQFWLPFDLWSEVNHLMVGFGQTICLPVNPQCHECLNRDICPSSGKLKKSPKKSPTKKEIKLENDLNSDTTIDSIKIVQVKENSLLKRTSAKDTEHFDAVNSKQSKAKVKKSNQNLEVGTSSQEFSQTDEDFQDTQSIVCKDLGVNQKNKKSPKVGNSDQPLSSKRQTRSSKK